MSIKLGEYDITVYGEPYKYDPAKMKGFENTVAHFIRSNIAATRAGQIILSRIRKTPGVVEIYPRYKDGLNAEAEFAWKTDDKGRMAGVDLTKMIVWYKPEQWDTSRPNSIPSNLKAFRPGRFQDEVLFHELTHCGRKLGGFKSHSLNPNVNDDKTGSPSPYADADTAAYNNIEEFIAILVSNIYMSENGSKVFRATHDWSAESLFPFILDQAQSSSEGFLTRKGIYALVKFFCQTDPIAPKLAEIDTPFNPVRAYFMKSPQDIELNRKLNKPTQPSPKPAYGGVGRV